MKTNMIAKHTKQYRATTDTWLVCKPRSGYVEQTSTTEEMRLLGLTADTFESMDPLDLLLAVEAGKFDDYIESISAE